MHDCLVRENLNNTTQQHVIWGASFQGWQPKDMHRQISGQKTLKVDVCPYNALFTSPFYSAMVAFVFFYSAE